MHNKDGDVTLGNSKEEKIGNLTMKTEGIQNLNMNPIALYHQMDAINLIGLKTRIEYN